MQQRHKEKFFLTLIRRLAHATHRLRRVRRLNGPITFVMVVGIRIIKKTICPIVRWEPSRHDLKYKILGGPGIALIQSAIRRHRSITGSEIEKEMKEREYERFFKM